ncbi:hypothetical protein ACJMK2_037579 [Sinanodonta woodiana]|uniref:Uncharacterized protein n=1 Tax=Sinanodonta woodiana TaxID=1069815 RepID=A0ABD3WM85_SINWO
MMDISKACVTYMCTVTSIIYLLLFNVSLAGKTLICLDEHGVFSNYSSLEGICCYGVYPRYNGRWEQKCCTGVKKPYRAGLEHCCPNNIKKNIPGIDSGTICNGVTADISEIDQDIACQQKDGEHFLFCESTRNCYDTRKSTCCPYSQELYETPSSKGICCGQKIFNLTDDPPCRSPKQNYGFCQPKLGRRHISKETNKQLEKICSSPHSYLIEIDQMEFKKNRKLYFTANVSQLVDQGFQQSIGNTTRHSIVLDIWMPSKCKSKLERSTFLVLSMTHPERLIQDFFYLYEKTDTIYNKYKTSQCRLDKIFQDVREIKERCLLERRNRTQSKTRIGVHNS